MLFNQDHTRLARADACRPTTYCVGASPTVSCRFGALVRFSVVLDQLLDTAGAHALKRLRTQPILQTFLAAVTSVGQLGIICGRSAAANTNETAVVSLRSLTQTAGAGVEERRDVTQIRLAG